MVKHMIWHDEKKMFIYFFEIMESNAFKQN